MAFFLLPEESRSAFEDAPEVKPDLQIGIDEYHNFVMVVGGRLVLTIDQDVEGQLARYDKFVTRGEIESDDTGATHVGEVRRSPLDEQERRWNVWLRTLSFYGRVTPADLGDALDVLGFIHLGPLRPLPLQPHRPPTVYGHLPFYGVCSGHEVFYRYECKPRGWRIDQAGRRVIGTDTFASPPSELPMISTGLSAVSRYALPYLLPARWRWELRPEAGTPVRYGACVPLYGQSGGGVEVMFPQPFSNIGPIADPIVLPVF